MKSSEDLKWCFVTFDENGITERGTPRHVKTETLNSMVKVKVWSEKTVL